MLLYDKSSESLIHMLDVFSWSYNVNKLQFQTMIGREYTITKEHHCHYISMADGLVAIDCDSSLFHCLSGTGSYNVCTVNLPLINDK